MQPQTGTDSLVILSSPEPIILASADVLPVGRAFTLDGARLVSRRIKTLVFEIESGLVAGSANFEFSSTSSLVYSADDSRGRITITGEGTPEEFEKAVRAIVLRVKTGQAKPSDLIFKLTMIDDTGSNETKTVKFSGRSN